MKFADVNALSNDQLKEKRLNLKKESLNLRFQLASGQQSNTSQFRKIRRDVARVLTVLNQRANTTKKEN